MDEESADKRVSALQSEREHLRAQLVEETERRKASEARHATLLNSVIEAVVTIDSQGNIQGFNREAEGIFGYSANEIMGENIRRLMPDSMRDKHDAGMHRYQSTGVPNIIGSCVDVVGEKRMVAVSPLN